MTYIILDLCPKDYLSASFEDDETVEAMSHALLQFMAVEEHNFVHHYFTPYKGCRAVQYLNPYDDTIIRDLILASLRHIKKHSKNISISFLLKRDGQLVGESFTDHQKVPIR